MQGIVLAAQINIDPARRTYDDATRARLVELFGAPERWASTTRSFMWTQVGAMVPPFTGQTDFSFPVAGTYDLEVAAAKYFYSLPDGEIPLTMHFSGTVLYEGADGRLQLTMVPWSCSALVPAAGGGVAGDDGEHYPGGGWVRLETETLDRLRRAQGAFAGCRTSTPRVRELLDD